ncbi:MAG: hypothetical protein N2253_05420 [Bacteroidia bacterium]|nr:hypothetical protein [Bacteroidia bacterium]
MKSAAWLSVSLLWAQAWYEPPLRGWQAMEVGPIVVWYIQGQEGLARQVGQWGADVYRELTGLLEFQPQTKLTLRLYPTPYAWAQTPPSTPKGMLVQPPSIAGVYPLPSRAATAALVRSEMTALLLQQLYFSEGVRLQNRSLLYLPDWFLWGFAYFWGEGWNSEDLARLEDVPEQAFRELSKRTAAPSPFYRSLYKSVWFYLYRTYGQRKVMDLLYMTRLTRSISEALYLTLNLTEEELWQKWQSFLQTLKKEVPDSENEVERRPLLTAAVAKDGETRAFAILRKRRVHYYLRLGDALYELPGRWFWRGGYYDPSISMSFSPQGMLVWLTYEREGLVLWQWNPAERKYARFPLPLVAGQGLSWAGENQLLLSGMGPDGKVKIYSFTFPQGTLRIVAEAEGDLLYPQQFGGDIYALWQPDTTRLSPLGVLWEPFRPVRRKGMHWSLLPYPPYYSLMGGWVLHDTALTSISDITGAGYPWTFGADTSYAAAWGEGSVFQWVGASAEEVFFLRYRGGRLRLYKAPARELLMGGSVFPPITAAEIVQFRLQRRAALLSTYAMEKPILPEDSDTLKSDTARSQRQPFYLFDEEVRRTSRRKSRLRFSSEGLRKERPTLPTSRALGRVPYHWMISDLRFQPALHPLMRFGWELQASATDWQADHAWSFFWRPYIDLRSSELKISYTRYRTAIQPIVELSKQSHFFPARRYTYTLRITSWHGKVGARYPIMTALVSEVYLSGIFSNRYNIGRTGDRDLSAESRSIGGGLRVIYDSRIRREGFIWSGWQASIKAEVFRRGTQWTYPLALVQVERFYPIKERLVLQLSGTAGFGGRGGRYFLLGGIPEWINYEFQNRAQVPLLTEPVGYYLMEYAFLPGFPYQARRGRNLLLGSITAHLPVLAWRNELHLPMRPMYSFDWYFGFHIGTTWTTGNPFSQKNPIDAEFIYRPPLVISVQTLKSPFIMSMGTGISFQIMKLPFSAEVYWPVEEGRVQKVTFLGGIRREF